MAEIQNRCDKPECKEWVCSLDEVCPVYTNAIALSCKKILGDKVTRADQIFLNHLNRGCKKTN